jgi:uncharacterized protein YhjY with autotransporter beta-barrel domain
MTLRKRSFFPLGLIFSGLFFAAPAYAECGGDLQCIAVSIDPAVAPAHGTPLTSAPLAFVSQPVATTSATRTIFVGAVGGPPPPPGALATLNAITLGGANAADFAITGGTCTVGAPSLPHSGPACTITVTFNPTTLGAKTASIAVQTTAITRTIPLTGTSTPVSSRLDPSQDADVVGLIGAQAQVAKRFARAQIANFQRRMELLHRGAGDTNTASAMGFGAGRGPGMNSGSGPLMSRAPVARLGVGVDPSGGIAAIANDTQPGYGPLMRVANEPGGLRQTGLAGAASELSPTSFIATLLSAASTQSVNLSSGSDRSSGSSGMPEGTGMWIGSNLDFGARDQTSNSSSLRFSTDGISVGIDHRYSDQLALGLGLGYARDKTDIGADGTKSISNASSITVYGSYQPTQNTFVDGLIGYGVLSYDTDRYVASAADFARGHRKGDQVFGSVAAGYEHRQDGLLLSPYGRLDFGIHRLKQATETGASFDALTYFDQTLPTLQFSLGLRAESQHQTDFGWALPRLRVEFKHDFEGDRQATIAYADQFAGPRYALTSAGVSRDSLLIGIGSDFLFRGGFRLGIDYQVQHSFGPDSNQAIQFWLSKDLDGKGLPSGLSSSKLFEGPVQIEAGYTRDDNLTRARDAADRLPDHIHTLNVSKNTIFPVTSHTRVVVAGFLNGEKLYTYTGLSRYSGGVRGEFQYRTSGAFDAPTLGIFGRASLDDYQSELRTGHRYSLGVTARQSPTDRIDVFGALASNVRDARNAVFDARDYAAQVNFDYALGRDGTLYLGGEYRRGDTVTSAPASPNYGAIAKVSVQDDAYGKRQLMAYRYEARTVLWTLGHNRPLGPRDSLDFSWKRARSTPTSQGQGVYSGGGSYTANQYSIAYLMRF